MSLTFLQDFKENFIYVKGNESLLLLVCAAVLAIMMYLKQGKGKGKLPPGPVGVPIFGYYPYLRKDPIKEMDEVANKYGNVVGLYIGPKYVVFLNDWEAVKDGLGQNTTVNRPDSAFTAIPFDLGFSLANDTEWSETRRLSSKTMKDIGLHSSHFEELLREEMLELIDRIIQEGERPVEVTRLFEGPFANTILSLILGERLQTDHPIVKSVVDSVEALLESITTLNMINFSTTLYAILQVLGFEKKFTSYNKVVEFGSSVSDMVEKKLEKRSTEPDDSFIVRYQEETEKIDKNKEKPYFSEEKLKGQVISILSGGIDTSRTTTIWSLIAMADHPDIQKKVHEELDQVVGKDGFIQWSERSKIPYTFAALLEGMRWRVVAPFPAPRIASEDMWIQNYFIPKGTRVITNNCRLHKDPKYWPNPDQFMPEHFLQDDGKKVNASPDSFNPFSYGKRICPGKLIAMMESLQAFTMLMQKFKVLPKEGKKVKYDIHFGITYQAKNVELRFIQRY